MGLLPGFSGSELLSPPWMRSGCLVGCDGAQFSGSSDEALGWAAFLLSCGLLRALGRLLLTAMGRGWDWGQSIGFTGLNAHPPLHTINTVLILINSAPLMVMQPLYAFLRMTR